MSSTWVPGWAGLAWVLIYAAIALGHLGHLAVMAGDGRLWHAGHVLMAAGMIDMFWPWGTMPAGSGAGEAIFAAAAAGFLALVAVRSARGRPVSRLWLLTTAHLAVMVYMFALVSLRYLVVVTVMLAGWQLVEAAAWASGRLLGYPPSGAGLRVSLALMSAGMAYMLLAMQFGMAMAGHGGPGMPGMPGM